jgi:large subunit ribosomal protein L32
MAVQQNKKSHSKKGMRRSHDRVATPTVVYCTHAACPSCGTYRGRQVVEQKTADEQQ